MASTQPPPNPDVTAPPLDPKEAEEVAPILIVGKRDDPSERGRTIIATRKIEPGEVVMISAPTVYPTSLSSICVFCSNCYRDLPSEPLRCTLCNVARFCSTACLEFSHSSLLCKALPSILSQSFDTTGPKTDFYTEDRLFLFGDSKWSPDLLFLLCIYSLKASILLQFISLRTNLAFRPDDPSVRMLHSQLASLIHPDHIPNHFSPEITSYLLSNEKKHSFPRILSPTHPQFDVCGVNGVYACAIHVGFSVLNHECLPNICAFNSFDHRVQNHVKKIRALHKIDKARELSISYLPLNTRYRDRQRILMEYHGFRCDCVRCVFESQLKEQDEEPGKRRRRRERKRKQRRQRGIGGAKREMPETSGDRDSYSKLLKRHVCDCGGCLAPFPPSDDGARQNWLECNNCGAVRKDMQAVSEDVRENEEAVTEDDGEDEQAVAEDVRELMTKLLPKMSEKMSKLLLNTLR